ncbi:MAG: hypothetical protein ABIQ18_08240, partial [Umezawaea sp.]
SCRVGDSRHRAPGVVDVVHEEHRLSRQVLVDPELVEQRGAFAIRAPAPRTPRLLLGDPGPG